VVVAAVVAVVVAFAPLFFLDMVNCPPTEITLVGFWPPASRAKEKTRKERPHLCNWPLKGLENAYNQSLYIYYISLFYLLNNNNVKCIA
jgi:hypothetical protein